MNDLARAADPADATPQALEFASEAFARIEPRCTAKSANAALRYAERFAKLRPPGDLTAIYLLAFAQNAEGGSTGSDRNCPPALLLCSRPLAAAASITSEPSSNPSINHLF